MPANPVILIDTTVFLNLLRVPGRMDDNEEIRKTFDDFRRESAKFVIPITTLIETGNHIAQCDGDRRGAAERFVRAIEAAREASPPWTIRDVRWGGEFLDALLAGDSTGSDLVTHLASKELGAGDVAILVERDQFLADTAFTDVRIWSLDRRLSAYS